MASTPEQRQLDERAAFSARFGLSRIHALAAVAALVVAAVTASSVVLAQLASWRTPERPATPGFLATALGAPQADAPLVREPAAGVAVTIDQAGFRVAHRGASLGVSSVGNSGPWTTFEHGVVRATPFGSETIAVERTKTEQYLTVLERQGSTTWRWRLDTQTLEPRLRLDGAVELLDARGANSGITILPAAILDLEGRNVTPASTRWSLDRDNRGWLLELDLDDSGLPLPYVIDPASAYPSPLELRSTTTSETGSWDLDNGTGTVNTTTDNVPARNATGWYPFNPGLSNTTQLASLPTSTDGMGWLVDPVGGATGFPAGTWSFTVRTDIPSATFVAGTAVMTIGVWKGTVSGGVFTPTGTILAPTDDPAAQNIRPNVNTNNFTVSYTLPKISLAAGETLFVDYWRHQTGNINTNTATQRQVDFYVNDGNAQITHPAADDAGPTHSLSLAPGATGALYAAGRLYYKGDTAGSFAFRNALTDTAGTGTAASGVLDLDYPAIATTGWTHNAETVTTSPNYQSSTYSWTASPSNPSDQTLTAEDNALQQSASVVPFVADVTAPVGGALTVNGVAATVGGATSFTTGTTVTIGTRTDWIETQDATASGIATSTLTREDGTLSGNVCSGYGAPATITGNPDQTGLSTGCYRYTLAGTDNVGNAVSITTTVKVDTSTPTISGTTVGSLSNANDSYASGSTFYYRSAGAGGTFAVDVAATDGESGLGNATYPALGGGFTPASSAGIAPPSPYSRTYTWPATTGTESGSKTVSVANNASGSTTTNGSFSIVSDSTAPTGGALTVNSVAANGGGTTSYDTDGSFSIGTRTDYSETLSATAGGLRSSTLTREDGTLSADSCSSYSGPATLVGTPAQNGLTTGCYRYTLTGTDNVGNTVTITTVVKVDTTAPTSAADALSTHATSASITVGYSTNDAATGVDSVQLWVDGPGAGGYALADTDTTPASPSFAYTASEGDGLYRFYTRASDDAGNTEAAPGGPDATTTVDTASPVSSADALAAYSTSASITVPYTASDATSGVDEVELWVDGPGPGGYALADTDTTPASPSFSFTATDGDGTYRFYTRARDNAGNTESAPGTEDASTVLDSVAPTSAVDALPATSSTVITVPYTTSDATSGVDEVELWVDGPGAGGYALADTDTTPASPSFSFTATDGDGTYRFYTRARDNAGNTEAAPGSDDATTVVDTTDPASAADALPAFTSTNTLTVAYTASDVTSGVDEVELWVDGPGAGGYALADTDTTPASPSFSFTAADGDGTYRFYTRARDNAGNTEAAPGSDDATTVVDTTNPVSAADALPAYTGTTSIAITYTSSDTGGSGVDEVELWAKGPSDGAYVLADTDTTPGTASFAFTASQGDGTYRFYTRARDVAGNTEAAPGGEDAVTVLETSPPTAPSLTFGSFTNASAAGTTVYVREGASGGYTVTADAADPDSGVASHTFPSFWGEGGSVASDPAATAYTFGTSDTAPAGAQTVTATNGAGLTGPGSSFTVVADTVAPVTTPSAAPAANGNGWHTSQPVSVTLSANDGGSGVAAIRYTTDGSDPTALSPLYAGAIAVTSTTTVKFRAWDAVGNVEAVGSLLVQVDDTAPTGAVTAPAAGANLRGTVTVTSDSADAGSGVATVAFQRSPADAGTWTTIDTDSAAPYSADWATGTDGLYDLRAVTTDTAGNTTTSPLVEDIRVDNTAPASTLTFPAGSGSYNAAGWDGGCASPGLCGTASDGGSGLSSVEVSIRQQGGDWYDGSAFTSTSEVWLPATGTGAWERAFASTAFPADGTFVVRVRATDAAGNVETPSSTTFTTDAVAPGTTIDSTPVDPTSATGASFAFSSNETATFECRVDGAGSFTACASPEVLSGLADGSHTFRVRAVDTAGNVDATPAVFTWTVDTSAPSAPSLSFGSLTSAAVTGSTVYYRPSAPAGSFTVTASSTDAGSGVASYAFPTAASGWSRSVSGADATYSHTGSPTEPGSGDVTATNGAGLTSAPTSFTVTADASAPTGMSATVTGGYRTAASVAVSVATGSDTGSGLALGTLVLERDDAGLTTDACDPFTGAWAPVTLSAGSDTSVASGTCVRYRVRISDRVGNEGVSAPSATVKIDTSAPSTPSLAFSNETNAATGGPATIWYRPGTNGGFTVTASATDAQSGIALYAFPSLGAGWASTGSGASRDYSFSGTPAEPGAQSVTAQNGAGTDSGTAGFSVSADATAPVTTAQCNGAACSAGYYTAQPVSVTLGATDAESGVAQVKYTTDGSDPSPVNGTVYAGAISVAATTTVKFRAYDRVGNAELVGTVLVRIDTTTPSVPALTLAETDPGSYVSGTTLFYNPTGSNSGTFTVDATASDAESGVDKVAFPALAGMTGGGDDTSPAFQGSYAWTASSTATGAATVTVHNGAGLTSSNSFTLAQDATAPTSSIACDGAACSAGWYTSSPVSVTLAASDGGSGVASLRYTLDGSDPVGGTPYTGAFDVAATATVRWAALDQVGNLDTGSELVRIDTTAPSAPNLSFGSFANASATGSTVFFRPGTTGGFTVTAATADGGSGVQHVAFPTLGANWTGGGNDPSAPYAQAYTFDASAADPAEPNDVVARNAAGLDSTATPFTVTADATAPTTTIACDGGPCPGGWTTSAADVTLSADDGSGSDVAEIRYTLDGSDPLASGTLYTGAFSVAATTTVRFAAVDAVGNAEAIGSQLLQIDDSKPTTPTLAFSAATNAHWDGSVLWFRAGAAGGFTVTPSSSDAQSGIAAYHFPALGSGWSNTGGDYTFAGGAADPAEPNDLTAENAAGLVSDPAGFTVTADGAAPTGAAATVTGGATAALSVAVAIDGGTDTGSGVDTGSLVVERQEADLDNGDGTCDAFGSWTTVTLTAAADTGVVSGKCYRYRVRSSDLVGNEATSAASTTVQVDTAAPSVTLDDPGANLAGTVVLSATATDAASGIASVAFQRSPADAGTWTTITASWDTTSVADGLYDLRAIATDAAGNATTSAVVEDRRVDNVSPDTTIDSAPADPDNDATPTFVFGSSESGSTFHCRFDGGAWSPCASPLTTGALPDGARTFEVRAVDASANPDPSPASHAWVLDTVVPTGGSITVADGWDTDGSVAIATDNGTDAGGTGVAAASAVVEREAATLTAGSCGTFDAAWSPVATPDASVAGGTCYRYRLRVRDHAGNWVTYLSASVVKVDLTAPSVPALTLANVSGTQVAGTIVYFKPVTSGSFTVTPAATDPESGGVTFSHPNLGTGWLRVGTTWSFDATAGDPNEPNNVTATNAAGLTSGAATFTVTADAAAPVTTATAAPAANGFGWHTASPVSVTLGAADGGSGVKEIRYTTDGSVPGPTSPLYAAPVDVVTPGTTTLTFRAEDNVGNLEAAATIVIRIDTTAPTTPTLAYSGFANASFDGTVMWFRPGVAGGFTATPSASDPESGIASHAFPALGGGWSNTEGAYAFTAAAADPIEPNEVVTTNGAGLASAGAPITVTADSTAPVSTATCNAVACSAGWYTAKPVTVVLTASDVQSGLDRIDWSTDGSAPANEYLGPLSLGAEGTTTVRVASRDNVGNVETTVSQDVRIDTVAPTAAIGAVAQYLRGTVVLTSTQSDATSGVGSVQFQIAPAGTGTWTNVPATWDTTATANGEYDVRVRVTDVAGNVTDSAPVASRWVDNLAPTITLDPPASPASGSVLLTSTANDTHSGLDTIEYAYSAAGANDWRTDALTGALWDTTQLADGAYDLRARATDRSGNASGWSVVNGIAVDNVPPTVSVTAPVDGSFVSAADADPFTLAASASDAGTGVASVEFLACATAGPTCSSWTSVDLDTTPAYTGSWTLPGDGERQVKAVATDNAGHTAEAVVTVTVDRTAPAASLTAPSAGANVRGTVALTASATDATSGVDSVAFQRSPAGASSWTTISSDTDGGDGWTGSLDTTLGGTPDGLYDLRVLVTDDAGNTRTDVAANVRVDNTAPTGTLTDPGQYLRGSLALSGTAADTGSGVASVAFQRSPESAGTWTAIATDTNGGDGWSTSFDTTGGGTPDGRYDLRVLVTDNAGNTFAHALPGRTVDNTKPTAAIANPGANLRLTVTLGGTADDVTAGIATVAFEFDNGGGWQLISTDSDGSDGWSASLNTTLPATPDGLYAFRLTATDRAGNQETSQIGGRRIDNTAPTASLTDPGPYLLGAVQLTASATDGGSGIDVVRFERSQAGSGGPWTQVGPDASFSGGSWRSTWNTSPDGLYDLRVVVDDLAGNRTVDAVASRRVDNTAPVTTDDATPGRHNTDQTVTLSRSDAGSGPSTTQYRVRPPGGSFGSWLSGTSVTILASAGDGVYTIEYYSTDAAGNVESVKSTDVLIDTTGPSGTVTDPSTFLRGLVTLTATADDPTDVSSVKFEYAPEGTAAWTQIGTDLTANGSDEYTVDWDTTGVADIAYDLQVTFLDSLGNPTVQSLTGKTVDNELPAIALTAPPAGAVRRNVIAITANAADGVSGMREVRFEVKPAGAAGFSQVDVDNGSSPYSTAWDSTTSPDGPTDLRVIAVDQAGNLRSATTTIFVDNNAPTLTVSAPSTAVSGTVTLTATGSSDIQSVVFKVGGSTIGTDTDGSDGFSVSWSTVGDGNQVLTAEATDVGGNVGTSSPVTVQVDNTAPTGAMTLPGNGATVSGTIALAASGSDAGSGVSGTSFEFKATSDSTWTAIGGSSWNTTAVATGAYNLRARVTDNAGNSALTAAITVQVVPPPPAVVPPAPPAAPPATPAPSDPAPSVVAASPADGSVLTASPASIDVTASEPLSAVTGLTLNNSPVDATITGASFSVEPDELETGAYTLAGTLVDATGKKTPFRLHFTVVIGATATPPFVEANAPAGTATSLTAVDGASFVTVPAGAVSGGGDWLVVRIQPLPTSSVPAAPTGAPTSVVDVSARWALAGTEVHSFLVPLEIVLTGASASLVPATLEDGRWRALDPVPGEASLPLLTRDGYVHDGNRVRILTRHLSVFALIPAPAQPRLVLSVAAAKTFSWSNRRFVAARVKVSRAATVTATLVGPRGARLTTWRRNVRAGASVLKLPMPRAARPTGAYRLVVAATAGGQRAQRTLGLRIVRKDAPQRTPGPVEVALAGDTRIRRTLALGLRGTGTRLIAADADGAFALAARGNVRVVLVDVDRHGTALVRDLNAVFPTLRLLALASRSTDLRAATRAGADAALPRSASSGRIARAVRRLAG